MTTIRVLMTDRDLNNVHFAPRAIGQVDKNRQKSSFYVQGTIKREMTGNIFIGLLFRADMQLLGHFQDNRACQVTHAILAKKRKEW